MLEAVFDRAKAAGRVAFIPYVMAGDPDLATTQAILVALGEAGADAIELGIPYGDPLADGPTVAAAGQRSLAAGTRLAAVLDLIARTAANLPPIVLFTYYNPVDRFGVERFAKAAAEAGAAGAIVPDVALEESAQLREALRARGLAMPLLVAPSTLPRTRGPYRRSDERFYLRCVASGRDGRRDRARISRRCGVSSRCCARLRPSR